MDDYEISDFDEFLKEIDKRTEIKINKKIEEETLLITKVTLQLIERKIEKNLKDKIDKLVEEKLSKQLSSVERTTEEIISQSLNKKLEIIDEEMDERIEKKLEMVDKIERDTKLYKMRNLDK